jgi:hypothetical protein
MRPSFNPPIKKYGIQNIEFAYESQVLDDEKTDEFAEYFTGKSSPKVLVTTSHNPGKVKFLPFSL